MTKVKAWAVYGHYVGFSKVEKELLYLSDSHFSSLWYRDNAPLYTYQSSSLEEVDAFYDENGRLTVDKACP